MIIFDLLFFAEGLNLIVGPGSNDKMVGCEQKLLSLLFRKDAPGPGVGCRADWYFYELDNALFKT